VVGAFDDELVALVLAVVARAHVDAFPLAAIACLSLRALVPADCALERSAFTPRMSAAKASVSMILEARATMASPKR